MRKFRAFATLTWVETKLFLRDPTATVFSMALPLILLFLLSAVFGNTPSTQEVNGMLIFRGASGAEYYMTVSVMLVSVAIGLLSIPMHLAIYREQGILRRLRASSIPAWSIFASQITVTIAVSAVGSVIMAIVSAIVYHTAAPKELLGVLVAFILATLCFAAIGFLIAALVGTARAAQGITLIVYFIFFLLSGTGPPRAVLPSTARHVTEVIPLTHGLIALQDPWFGWGWSGAELGILLLVTVVTAVPALYLFSRDSR